jgi:hypothetical protein
MLETRKPRNMAKYCRSDDGKSSYNPLVSPIRFFKVLFPFSTKNILEVNKHYSSILSVCASQMTHYTVLFYNFLLEAHDAGFMDGMFAIELNIVLLVMSLK